MTGVIVDIVTGRPVAPTERTYGGVVCTTEKQLLTQLVRCACFNAAKQVLEAAWSADKTALVITLTSQRWAAEVLGRQTTIGDRMVLFGLARPQRLVIVTGRPKAQAA